MLTQKLQQKLQQKLSPQQIQVIKLLEIPTVGLEERIQQELEENPALEEGTEITESETSESELEEIDLNKNDIDDNIDYEEYMQQDDYIPDYKTNYNNSSQDDKHENIPFSIGTSFHEHLIEQLHLRHLSEEDNNIAEYIIGNIDEEGYLRREEEAMIDDIAFQLGKVVNRNKINQLLQIIQDFEPSGVGAHNLQECLSLQIAKKEPSESIKIAQKIIDEHFDSFTKKHFEKILKKLSINEAALKNATAEIVKLNPKPGSAWDTILEKNMQQLIPDFILEVENGEPYVVLNNRDIPELRINRTYKEMFEDYSKNKENNKDIKNAVIFVKQKIDSAKWFIDALKQRNNTLLSTMTAIVNFQKEFFLKGDEVLLKPMILKDIAEITGLDISTISRVSNSKYIQTDFGVFPIKFFFSESLQNDNGEEISSREIKKILQTCIDNENKKQPVTDEQLVSILKEKGYIIARRTIAKYREQLYIPVARLRKTL